jgi:O-6-methylguanine DNA methyltransferase
MRAYPSVTAPRRKRGRRAGEGDRITRARLATVRGEFEAVMSETGLCCLTFPNQPGGAAAWVAAHVPHALIRLHDPRLIELAAQLNAYFQGRLTRFSVALDLRGTAFQLATWQALQEIPYGQVRSYSEIAAAIQRPEAVRAVGAANGANPVPVVVPCHRVIGANGALTGFGAGVEWKRWLLAVEDPERWGEGRLPHLCRR